MELSYNEKIRLIEKMTEYVTPHRKQLFEQVIEFRTRHVTIVLENIFQPHNASAVLRSCDLTGIQDVHVIENYNTYTVNQDVALGASKWLSIMKYNTTDDNTPDTYASLRKRGYKIVATTPHLKSVSPDEIALEEKIALVFGTELTGLTPYAIENADEYMQVPMVGFTESYNISVSAALSLYTITQRLHRLEINWRLTPDEKADIMLQWLRNTINKSPACR
ncbi:MAG: rRNA methyltransferase [Bacteroidetes bacterium CG18_big_fil_WC_8_21_14_2_50_41_14]|nr:MAG: rRNA methyltransferase [Bacteroidetes bacterium CG18_big_fil_WC_8_21_14_2_50_41_14]PJB56809.1 MAG: rRNA methyltransferase [Bacteroidetes bacterium CG_4_9_14_3_um_filter_41_19]